jgi:hypothetical protein
MALLCRAIRHAPVRTPIVRALLCVTPLRNCHCFDQSEQKTGFSGMLNAIRPFVHPIHAGAALA